MKIFKTSTSRFKEIDELILEQGSFKKVDSVIYSIVLTAEEYAGMEKYVREAIRNGITVYSGFARTGKLEILPDTIIINSRYLLEFVATMDKAEQLESMMLKLATANR